MRHLLRCLRLSGLLAILATLAFAAPCGARADDVVVVVHRDNANPVDLRFVHLVYLGRVRSWPDGTPVAAFDQSEGSEARERFCSQVLRMALPHVKAVWSQNIFTGKALPPRVAGPDAAVLQAVAADPRAIGYVRSSQVNESVRVVGALP